jgi:hypothetical protein
VGEEQIAAMLSGLRSLAVILRTEILPEGLEAHGLVLREVADLLDPGADTTSGSARKTPTPSEARQHLHAAARRLQTIAQNIASELNPVLRNANGADLAVIYLGTFAPRDVLSDTG